MDQFNRKALCACASADGVSFLRRGFGSPRNRKALSTGNVLQAAKTSKPPKPLSRKVQSKLPEYKIPTRKSPSPPLHPPPRPNPLRYRSIPIVLGSLTLIGITSYCTYAYITLLRPSAHPIAISASSQSDVSSRYDSIATSFDDQISSTERTMGIMSLRKKLVSQAHGDVLEVSIGTGRNLEFYDWNFKGFNGVGKVDVRGDVKKGKVRSFTAVDLSAEMLEVAHEKFSKMFPGILGVRWVIGDAGKGSTIPSPPKNANERGGNLEGMKYDTVVQTFGLCSVKDPVGFLKSLGDVVKEEDGRILLLEHGRGKWKWLNAALDKSAEAHAKQFGCWWNRDLGKVVEECGLEVVKVETPKWWHGGTTWWIELKKPRSKPVAEEAMEKVVEVKEKVENEAKKKGWWL